MINDAPFQRKLNMKLTTLMILFSFYDETELTGKCNDVDDNV